MSVDIHFGTDGWRAIIADDFTFENVRLCAQSVADYVTEQGQGHKGLVVGYDTRFASDAFAQAVAEVLAGNGIVAHLCQKPAPTPTISYAILSQGAAGAVVITASHNPPQWNGFKYKPEYAGSASPEVVAVLERGIQKLQRGHGKVQRLPLAEAERHELIRYFDPEPAYIAHLADLLDCDRIRKTGLRIVHDAMYGAGAGYLARILEGGPTEVITLHGERNPLFPGIGQPEPIGEHLKPLTHVISEHHADIGLATDGDADRLGVVDELGQFVNQLTVFGLLTLYLLEVRGWRGPLVKSLSTTSMIDALGRIYGVPVIETPVGFKYIGPKMMSENAIIGGEESGGFGFARHIPERDGVLAGLFILDMMVQTVKTPVQLVEYLFDKVGPHFYRRIDLPFPASERQRIVQRLDGTQPDQIAQIPVSRISTADGYKYTLSDGSWVLIRFSGTEPLLRIYTETRDQDRVSRLLAAGQELVGLD
ncbi:MAG: phosphoglucomutase/phosphomannomutase family protein [Chloroflexi bacterium]|nr:phosphoglucomutase/phosphomannomutase family protein [Chloroflexota bacterium]